MCIFIRILFSLLYKKRWTYPMIVSVCPSVYTPTNNFKSSWYEHCATRGHSTGVAVSNVNMAAVRTLEVAATLTTFLNWQTSRCISAQVHFSSGNTNIILKYIKEL
jgi:hypothetical protein